MASTTLRTTPPHIATHKYAAIGVTTSEWRFVLGIIAFVLLFTSLPFAYAYLTAPPDKQFMGIMLDVPDHGQYFSWMRELTYAPLSSNKLTPEPNQPIFFNLLWFGLGRIGGLLGLNYDVMYQVMRVIGVVAFLLLAYRICAWFFDEVTQRRAAFLIITFTAGFGWVLVILKYVLGLDEPPLPLTLYVAESNTFQGILGYPHFIAALLYVFVFDLVLRGQEKSQLRHAVYAGLWALFLGWQHAYDLVLVYAILGAYIALSFLRDRKPPWYLIKSFIIIGFISWWPALYSAVLTKLDPVWKEVLAQFGNAGVYTPNLIQLPILLGPAFLVALFTAVVMLVKQKLNWANKWLFALSWFFVQFPLVYLPVDFQIHMLNGWQIPIALLAVYGIYNIITDTRQQTTDNRQNDSVAVARRPITARSLTIVLIIALLPTNLYLWAWRFIDLRRHDYPFYLHKTELAAMRWIEQQPDPDAVVLSSLTTGQYLPMFTGKPTYLAHWAQTLRFFEKRDNVQTFFAAQTTDPQRQHLLQQHNVRYVFFGPAERELGGYNPATSSFLKLVFETPDVKVFETKTPDP
jgi:hypothetical protein